MEIIESSHPQATVLALNGRLDGHASPMVESSVESVLARAPGRLVFDLTGLDYVSSAGLRVFLTAAKKCRAGGGAVVFAGLAPSIREVFALSGFLEVLQVEPTVAAALARG